jgi:hypothetical protein
MTRNDQLAQMIGNDRPHKDSHFADTSMGVSAYTMKPAAVRQGPPPPLTPQPFASMRRP